MNLINYIKAYFTSEKDILSIINFTSEDMYSYNSIINFIIAIFLISFPSFFSIYNYVFNIILLGFSISLITLISSFIISKLNKKEKDLLNIFIGNLNFISVVIFCNVSIIILMYLIGIPFNASSILISVAATLISTYYFIVILTYAFSLQIKYGNSKLKLLFEIVILLLWTLFVFFILPLTI